MATPSTTTFQPLYEKGNIASICHLSAVLSRGAYYGPLEFILYLDKYRELLSLHNKKLEASGFHKKKIWENMYKISKSKDQWLKPDKLKMEALKKNGFQHFFVIDMPMIDIQQGKNVIANDQAMVYCVLYNNKFFFAIGGKVWKKNEPIYYVPKRWRIASLDANGKDSSSDSWGLHIHNLLLRNDRSRMKSLRNEKLDGDPNTFDKIEPIVNKDGDRVEHMLKNTSQNAYYVPFAQLLFNFRVVKKNDGKWTNPNYPVFISGHGIGGAVAEKLAIDLCDLWAETITTLGTDLNDIQGKTAEEVETFSKRIIVANWGAPKWHQPDDTSQNAKESSQQKIKFYKFRTHGDIYPHMPRGCATAKTPKDNLLDDGKTTSKLHCGRSNGGKLVELSDYNHIGDQWTDQTGINDEEKKRFENRLKTNTTKDGEWLYHSNIYLVKSNKYENIKHPPPNDFIVPLISTGRDELKILGHPEMHGQQNVEYIFDLKYNKPLGINQRNEAAHLRMGYINGKYVYKSKDFHKPFINSEAFVPWQQNPANLVPAMHQNMKKSKYSGTWRWDGWGKYEDIYDILKNDILTKIFNKKKKKGGRKTKRKSRKRKRKTRRKSKKRRRRTRRRKRR